MPLPRLSLICTLLMLAACGGGGGSAAKPAAGKWASMSNPASKYCAELGGRLELRAEQAGDTQAASKLRRRIAVVEQGGG